MAAASVSKVVSQFPRSRIRPAFAAVLRRITRVEAQRLLERVIDLPTATDVERIVNDFNDDRLGDLMSDEATRHGLP